MKSQLVLHKNLLSGIGAGAVLAIYAVRLALQRIDQERQRRDALDKRSSLCSYQHPTVDQLPATIGLLRDSFGSGRTLPLQWRFQQLQQLRNLIVYNKDEIINAVQKDLGKATSFEIISSEINLIVAELDYTVVHLKQWTKPQKVYTPLAHQPASSYIRSDPLGVVLVISPWNYPVNLALVPFMAAIAAGNCVFLKLSRHSAHVGRTLSILIPRYMDMACIGVEYEGGAPMITALIQHQWDHIFFTGSVAVGKVVYEAAAKHLTPVTLELGGKNPCIVDDTVDIDFAAKKIAWGKWYNNGQTCIGVDHVLVVESMKDKLIAALQKHLKDFFGDDPKTSASYSRIISKEAATRLSGLIRHGTVICGGQSDVNEKYLAPTILDDVDLNSKEEIFGPILPIISVKNVQEAVDFTNARPLPLAVYVFTTSKRNQELVLSRTRSGAVLVNEVMLHFTNHLLPFGGVGASGIGKYHGKYSFDALTNKRACIVSNSWSFLDNPFRYAPYTPFSIWAVDFFTRIHW